jgi:electron transfer flavoprotein beta subunit
MAVARGTRGNHQPVISYSPEALLLNSVVCIAHVPDTESRIKIAEGRKVDETGLKFIVSPYDEYALEEAIRLKEAKGGDVTVITFGPDRAQQALREALARGATKAVHVKGESADADSLGIAKVLAAAIRSVPHDLVFLGKQGVGTDNGLVGPMLAELLGYPQVNVVTHLELGEGTLTAHREIEGAEEVLEAPTPAIITAQKGLNEPRYASLKGIMAAKKVVVDTKSIGDLGLEETDIYRARVVVVSLELPPEKSGGRKIDGADANAAAQEILKYIREEAKAL